jgi:hypothetical protein
MLFLLFVYLSHKPNINQTNMALTFPAQCLLTKGLYHKRQQELPPATIASLPAIDYSSNNPFPKHSLGWCCLYHYTDEHELNMKSSTVEFGTNTNLETNTCCIRCNKKRQRFSEEQMLHYNTVHIHYQLKQQVSSCYVISIELNDSRVLQIQGLEKILDENNFVKQRILCIRYGQCTETNDDLE